MYGLLACALVKRLFKKKILTSDILKRTVVFFRKWLYLLYKSIRNAEWNGQLSLLANLPGVSIILKGPDSYITFM